MLTQQNPVSQVQISIGMRLDGKLAKDSPLWKDFHSSFATQELTQVEIGKRIHAGYSYTNPHRGRKTNANLDKATVIAIDIDTEDDRARINTLLSNPLVREYAGVLHTTASHTREKPRCRILFFLDEPITDAKEYKRAAKALLSQFPEGDEACTDPCRGFFGAKGCRFVVLNKTLPLALVRSWYPKQEERVQREREEIPASEASDAYAEAVFQGVISDVYQAGEGHRNHTLNKGAFRLGQLVGGGKLNWNVCHDALYKAARAIGLEHHESELTIVSAMSAGESRPLIPSPKVLARGQQDDEFVNKVKSIMSTLVAGNHANMIPGVKTRNQSDLNLLIAFLNECATHRTDKVRIGMRALAEKAGLGGTSTVSKALARLSKVISVHEYGARWQGANVYAVNIDFLWNTCSSYQKRTLSTRGVSESEKGNNEQQPTTTTTTTPPCREVFFFDPTHGCSTRTPHVLGKTYAVHMTDDEFLRGTSKDAKVLAREQGRDPKNLLPAYGPIGAQVCTLLATMGPLTRQQLVEITGVSMPTIKRITIQGEEEGIFTVTQERVTDPKVYSVDVQEETSDDEDLYAHPDMWAILKETRPLRKTFNISITRRQHNVEESIVDVDDELNRISNPARRAELLNYKSRLQNKLFKIMRQRYPLWTAEEANTYVNQKRLGKHRSDRRYFIAKHIEANARAATRATYQMQQREDFLRLTAEMVQLRQDGVPKRDWHRLLTTAGWPHGEVIRAMSILSGKKRGSENANEDSDDRG